MHGSGTFIDKRLDVAANPIAMKTKLGESRGTPDNVTAKLAALHYYQLSLPAPAPPENSFDSAAAKRGNKSSLQKQSAPRATFLPCLQNRDGTCIPRGSRRG
jgi:hypothetical protein